METQIYTLSKSANLPYENLKKVFYNFNFEEREYIGKGNIKKQMSNHFAEVEICINIGMRGRYIWDVTQDQIPFAYFDVILTTIKSVYDNWNKYDLEFKIVRGNSHPVDSRSLSFEIATFRALANIVEFDLTKYGKL